MILGFKLKISSKTNAKIRTIGPRKTEISVCIRGVPLKCAARGGPTLGNEGWGRLVWCALAGHPYTSMAKRGAVARSVRASSPQAIFKACVGSIPRLGSVLQHYSQINFWPRSGYYDL